MAALIIRIKHAIQVINPLKENIRTNYFPIHRAVTHFVPTIEEVIGGKNTGGRDSFSYHPLFDDCQCDQARPEYVYQSVVVCNHGMATGNLLAENLKKNFPNQEFLLQF